MKTKNLRWIWGVIIFCFLIITLIWTNFIHQKNADKRDTIAAAIQRNSNLAVALEQYAIRTIHNADAVLQLIKLQYENKGNSLDIDRVLFANAVNKDIIKGVAVIDSTGKIVNTNLAIPHSAALDFSDRDYFTYHARHNDDTLFISKPIVSKTIGKSVIVISRRINTRDEGFKGVIAVQIEPASFTSFYAQANLNRDDIISLIAPDGITYARRTGSVESNGENIIKSPLFQHIKNNPDSFYFAKDAIRDIPSYFSYRKFREYPIIATVGSSREDILGGYYTRARKDFTSTIVISILVILFSVMVCLILINRKKMLDKQVEEEQRYQQQLTEQVIAAQEREREAIGHELHDNVNQVLTTVKLYLETAMTRNEMREELIPKSIQLLLSSIDEIRNLSRDLSAPTLGTRLLVDSITALVEMVSSSSGLLIQFDHRQYGTHVSMNQKLAIYRIIQEQLNNVIKHAGAAKVWITLVQNKGTTILVIRDDGKGFNTDQKRNGIGLNNITSRARVFNGKVEIESAPQKGCMLKVVLPIIEKEQALS